MVLNRAVLALGQGRRMMVVAAADARCSSVRLRTDDNVCS